MSVEPVPIGYDRSSVGFFSQEVGLEKGSALQKLPFRARYNNPHIHSEHEVQSGSAKCQPEAVSTEI